MKNYALKRLLQLIPILLAITFLSYGMMRIAGSDVVEQKMENTSGTVSQEMIDNARAELGLDKPFVVQYFTWLGNLLRGDMGTSYVSNKPVFSTFVSKLPATLLLTAVSILLTVLISIPLGIWSAVKQNTATDYVIRTASFIGNSLPNFFVSLLLMYFFAIRLGWFPVISGGVSLQSVALPALTLAIAMSAKYLRQVRATVLDELSKDYVLGARARVLHDPDQERHEGLARDDHHAADAFDRLTARRHGHRRVHLHVGRRRQAGGGCDQHARLPDHSGLRDVDGHHLRRGQPDHRPELSLP